jgi:ubiquinone/menaquinone biosynthesis C-methylase UbiE
VIALAAAMVVLFAAGLGHRSALSPTASSNQRIARLLRPTTVLTALAASVAAWAPFTLLLPGASANPWSSWLPDIIRGDEPSTTIWFALTLVLGLLAAAMQIRNRRRVVATDAAEHFDTIAQAYLDQFAPHIWELLLKRRVDRLVKALPAGESNVGLDLGCGLGQQALVMAQRGFHVIGIDPAHGLVRQARAAGLPVITGSATAIPLEDASVDFVYTIGVLHHLSNPGDQTIACAEIARVLKPGGRLVVQETNILNPLFAFYMTYLFPLLKSIDEGTEWWIPPERWSTVQGFGKAAVQHFTFLPDFLPAALLRPLLALEHWLERGPLHRYSVHYQAELQRGPS